MNRVIGILLTGWDLQELRKLASPSKCIPLERGFEFRPEHRCDVFICSVVVFR
jgi:hypothetical protein